ncbi:hypothetical protein [Pseudomonas jinjuensis]|uniref:Peptidase M4 n=1 Tax=Pseudomonas jinjuensis TaxID=198616 RepID=A0A1G9ZZT8_9PSED|nr:hypothetical protein [Pseudomonas jinjuensis]SDN26840.1 hypothetical protein SAMN05216193_10237 [Pseudomonas jinjuensis]
MAKSDYPPPAMRRLRVYAFDPQASTLLETAQISHATIEIPWEARWEDPVSPGPTNEYLEVIDIDPASGQFYPPLDLNDPHVLAQDGLLPSEGDPRFHQQMVFAVAMKTIKLFERALGRKVFWGQRKMPDGSYEEVRKLRIYPHALREANAYYDPLKKALLFGYFKASLTDPGVNLPGGWVFTALSHDIIAHETTHAILDGLHRRYSEPTSVDSLAFHEAFADIVALLMHFTLPEAVSSQLAAQRGNLAERTWLSGLARQFGEATGRYAALRDAIDDKGSDGLPDPTRLAHLNEPHERGAVLVAAVFDAFVSIYQKRTADLFRLARIESTQTALPTELIGRLTHEAVKTADHVLRMCIRALDYLPPVDVHFGEYLRAIITADSDLIPSDPLNYRLAMIQAFRRRGILPDKCLSLAPDSLLWETPTGKLAKLRLPVASSDENKGVRLDLTPQYRRRESFQQARENRRRIWRWLLRCEGERSEWEQALGVFLVSASAARLLGTLRPNANGDAPAVEVHSVRSSRRSGPDGQDLRQLIVEVTQKRDGYFDAEIQRQRDGDPLERSEDGDFAFRGGATLIIDLRDGALRYIVRKSIEDDERLEAQRRFLLTGSNSLALTYRGHRRSDNPFAMTHRGV